MTPRVEARGAAKYPMDRTVPTAKNDPSQMSVVPRPRGPVLHGGLWFCINGCNSLKLLKGGLIKIVWLSN